jgi:general secretion pathway protein I
MNRGFTLLEMLVATLIMAIAVVGLLSGISASMRNADRLTEHDRAVMLARSKMDALLLDLKAPRNQTIEGVFDPALMGGTNGGWRARFTLFDLPPSATAGWHATERLDLEVWWMSGAVRRSFSLEGFRRTIITPADMLALPGAASP